jgi:hypothetical protein
MLRPIDQETFPRLVGNTTIFEPATLVNHIGSLFFEKNDLFPKHDSGYGWHWRNA